LSKQRIFHYAKITEINNIKLKYRINGCNLIIIVEKNIQTGNDILKYVDVDIRKIYDEYEEAEIIKESMDEASKAIFLLTNN
jgi:hypothetical protein